LHNNFVKLFKIEMSQNGTKFPFMLLRAHSKKLQWNFSEIDSLPTGKFLF